MIDFINPRSKKTRLSIVISIFSIAVLAVGASITFKYSNEYRQAKALENFEALPSGDVVIEGLDIDELLALYEEKGEEQVEEAKIDEVIEEVAEEIINKEIIDPVIEENNKVVNENSQPTPTPTPEPSPVPAPEPQPEPEPQTPPAPTIPQENILVVPQMGVNGLIYEGQGEGTLSKGLWRMPMTSGDPNTGNMVVTSHRYLRRPPNPNTFYLLDKVKIGDQFYMYWEGKKYDYKVREIKIIEPEQIDILYNTPTPQLTMFSCTPLFTSDKRLVVIADLIN